MVAGSNHRKVSKAVHLEPAMQWEDGETDWYTLLPESISGPLRTHPLPVCEILSKVTQQSSRPLLLTPDSPFWRLWAALQSQALK